ncbi:GntR family transcriptional regulator [Caballeronia sp. LZ035]|uniref:GntR family transcriptional regulator n=1 Tax=Caballeronia sp. LZ035 TaxID=3038568 RepID=UPI00285BEA77|nr:GntR family transcriptional regulator [Caballeronia sp. LZ035]MDR5760593.1 GntR family transcriptional regulator [Caballeronia sp. LZ035]
MDQLHIPQLAREISLYIRAAALTPGTRLPERKLAEQFRVSRTPVSRALRLLADWNVVVPSTTGGYLVGDQAATAPSQTAAELDLSEEESLYLKLAEEHSANQLSGKQSENVLMRRYAVGRGVLTRVLLRAAVEGWAERLPGHGWALIPLLTTDLTYEQSSRFRIIIEPAAILEPTFELDRAAIEQCRAQQVALFEKGAASLSPVEVFEIGSRFHEAVLRCSRNQFLINGLTQVNRLRRLAEYGRTLASENWRERCMEHVRIADMLLDGDRQAASDLLKQHLIEGMREKTQGI